MNYTKTNLINYLLHNPLSGNMIFDDMNLEIDPNKIIKQLSIAFPNYYFFSREHDSLEYRNNKNNKIKKELLELNNKNLPMDLYKSATKLYNELLKDCYKFHICYGYRPYRAYNKELKVSDVCNRLNIELIKQVYSCYAKLALNEIENDMISFLK